MDRALLLPRKDISLGDNLLWYFWKLGVEHAPKPALIEQWRRSTPGGGDRGACL
jgi:hypothetical protein